MFINTDTSNDEMNSVHENDKNESDVKSSQLYRFQIAICRIALHACMPLTPRTESVTSSSNMMLSLASRKDTNPFSPFGGKY